jgi:hypothetical protein
MVNENENIQQNLLYITGNSEVSGWQSSISDDEAFVEPELLENEVPEALLQDISKTKWADSKKEKTLKLQARHAFEAKYGSYTTKALAKKVHLESFVLPQLQAEDTVLSNKIHQTPQYVRKVQQEGEHSDDKSNDKTFDASSLFKVIFLVVAYCAIAYAELEVMGIYMTSTERVEMFVDNPNLALLIPWLMVVVPAIMALVFYNNNAKRLARINMISNIVLLGYAAFVVTWTMLLSDVMKPDPPLANLMMAGATTNSEGFPWATAVSMFQAILNVTLLSAIAMKFYQVIRDNLNKGYFINPSYTKLASQQKTIRALIKRAQAVVALLKKRIKELEDKLEQFINQCEIQFDLIKQQALQQQLTDRQDRERHHFTQLEDQRREAGL